MYRQIFISFFIFIFSCFVLSINANGQVVNDIDKDALARSVMAFDEDNFDLNFETSTAKAYSGILIRSFKEMLPIPHLDFTILTKTDKTKITILYNTLIELRTNPPTWNEIIAREEEKIKTQSAPPTPPVWAGSEEAKKHYSAKNKYKVKYNPGNMLTPIEQSASMPDSNQVIIEDKHNKQPE